MVWFERLMGMLESEPFSQRNDERSKQREERLLKLTQIYAYRLVTYADGWQQHCSNMHIDGPALMKDLPGYDNVCRVVDSARHMAFTEGEATAYLRDEVFAKELAEGAEPTVRRIYRIDTADDVARSMREFLDKQLESWQ